MRTGPGSGTRGGAGGPVRVYAREGFSFRPVGRRAV